MIISINYFVMIIKRKRILKLKKKLCAESVSTSLVVRQLALETN